MSAEPEPDALPTSCCAGAPGGCSPEPNRRQFIELVGLAAAAAIAGSRPVMGGPYELADFEKLVPADKKLDPDWVGALTARGELAAYKGSDLAWIGMPVGGIGAGQLYLGGDGTLWHWDVFNQLRTTGDRHYAEPLKPVSPLDQGFAIRVSREGQSRTRPLDRHGFADVTFRGTYPIGVVEYDDPEGPVAVTLEAFSPFIPLNVDDSSLPATVLRFTVKNRGRDPVEVELAGWLENAVCLDSGSADTVMHRNRITRHKGVALLECSAEPAPEPEGAPRRADIVFEDFEAPDYRGWTATGTAFGPGPVERVKMPSYQGDVGAHGERLVNSHNTRGGEDVRAGDAHTGTLTSAPFVIERRFIHFLVGGGAHRGKTCVNLVVDGEPVLSATGRDDNRMRSATFDVARWQGQSARMQVVDAEPGPWGNVGVDQIVFSDRSATDAIALRDRHDFGTMALALLDRPPSRAEAVLPAAPVPAGVFPPDSGPDSAVATRPFGHKLVGALAGAAMLAPGEETGFTFVLAWHFPNLRLDHLKTGGRWYATRFASATDVAAYLAAHLDRLAAETRLWRDTWYDSTLPYWFLDRTFASASTLATSTCYRFGSGRFYGWEGVGCCPGTCTHVWYYAQAVARLFPALERDTRERVDLGLAFDPKTGAVDHRGEFHAGAAVDGQAGTVLRCYREHQMSPDGAFLARNWPRIRQALRWLIDRDGNGDGILEGAQHNTLDAEWFGTIPWLTGLYHAALRAGAEMALEQSDAPFARECRALFDAGRKRLDNRTWREDHGYFVQVPDPRHLDAVGSFDGCAIDQVLGESWAHQVGLGPVMEAAHVRQALASLWRYNFTPDVGPYRQAHKAGRWYALAGEAGLLMVTHPFGTGREFKDHPSAWSAMYFNECMTGFEHQVAGHMVAAGMLTEGLAVERAIHDRYHASRRNPWNEVECGDHYARAMASYGVFVTACGYEYHGPKGALGFAPKVRPEDFRAAFTTAEGWGTFRQRAAGGTHRVAVELRYGRLRVNALRLELVGGLRATRATVEGPGGRQAGRLTMEGARATVTFAEPRQLAAGDTLSVTLT